MVSLYNFATDTVTQPYFALSEFLWSELDKGFRLNSTGTKNHKHTPFISQTNLKVLYFFSVVQIGKHNNNNYYVVYYKDQYRSISNNNNTQSVGITLS